MNIDSTFAIVKLTTFSLALTVVGTTNAGYRSYSHSFTEVGSIRSWILNKFHRLNRRPRDLAHDASHVDSTGGASSPSDKDQNSFYQNQNQNQKEDVASSPSPSSSSSSFSCASISEELKPCCWAEWDKICSKEQGSKSVCNADGVGNDNGRISGVWCPPNPSCSTNGIWYMPLDMAGQERTVATPAECQQRCRDTAGCRFFNNFPNGGCHITTGASGTQSGEDNPTVLSGSVQCIEASDSESKNESESGTPVKWQTDPPPGDNTTAAKKLEEEKQAEEMQKAKTKEEEMQKAKEEEEMRKKEAADNDGVTAPAPSPPPSKKNNAPPSCPAGEGKYGTEESCFKCQSGTYQNEEGLSATCKSCESGRSQEKVGSKACEDCLVGFISFQKAITCDACQAGRYQDEANQITCKVCDAGRYQDLIGSTEPCKSCSPGHFHSSTGNTQPCKSCAKNTFQLSQGSSSCEHCPIGTYNGGSNTPCQAVNCPSGTYVLGTTSCPTPAGFDSGQSYPGESTDTYLNYCNYMVNKNCARDYCASTFKDACRNQCDRYSGADNEWSTTSGGFPPHCQSCPKGFVSTTENAVQCDSCSDGVWASPMHCLRPGDVSREGNVGLNSILLGPEGFLFVFNKSHPLSMTWPLNPNCGIIIHPLYWEFLKVGCFTASGYLPSCAWHDMGHVASLQMTAPESSSGSSIAPIDLKDVCGLNSTSPPKVGDSFFSPIALGFVDISNVTSYCHQANERLLTEWNQCKLEKDGGCACAEKAAPSWNYERNLCGALSADDTIVSTCTPPAVPQSPASYDVSSSRLTFQFDQLTDGGASTLPSAWGTQFLCSFIVMDPEFTLGTTCKALFERKRKVDSIVIFLSLDATIVPGDSIWIKGGIFQPASGRSASTANIQLELTLDSSLPLSTLAPQINLQAPSRVGLCDGMFLDTTLSRGDGGRPFKRYQWIVSSRSLLSSNMTTLFASSRGSTLDVPSNVLPREKVTTLSITVVLTNFLGLTSNATVLVDVEVAALPTASILGPS